MFIELSEKERSICLTLLQKELEDCQRIVKRAQACLRPDIEETFSIAVESIQSILSKFKEE